MKIIYTLNLIPENEWKNQMDWAIPQSEVGSTCITTTSFFNQNGFGPDGISPYRIAKFQPQPTPLLSP